MKTKIKKIGYGIAAAVLMAPMAALAQFEVPGDTGLPGNQNSDLLDIVTNAMKWLLAIVGVIGIIGFAIAGILYLTAAGSETQIEKAKKAMMYSILGIVVALAGLVIIYAVQEWLGGSSATF